MIQFRTILVERGSRACDIFNRNIGPPAISLAHTNLNKLGAKAIVKFMRRSIMRRVPVFTYTLKDRIDIKKWYIKPDVEIRIYGNTPYAGFQERGYWGHYIPIEFIRKHEEDPFARASYVERVSKWIFVAKHTPYVAPAYRSLRKQLPLIYKRKWYKEMVNQGTVNKRTEY